MNRSKRHRRSDDGLQFLAWMSMWSSEPSYYEDWSGRPKVREFMSLTLLCVLAVLMTLGALMTTLFLVIWIIGQTMFR